ncbi:hypothetical protein CJJ23_00750 [Mycoplasmopsis agassizii]|uniref:Mycoplasma lipoprotein C-terminal domain-containing protein n=1 Tax=Mycoplasmopsis agassizii TaxID=33922 RepID=A0A269TJK2_9BACT|nr:hypothetical protein [Mycoplasmopsis agassizii]PAK21649.1 hypothetical protein CJJ23_00750 [Mycoplasmopsis agassizii]
MNKNRNVKHNFKKYFSFLALATVPAVAATAIACGGAQEKVEREKVIFATAQQSTFPMYKALKLVTDIYNEEMKDTEGFLPVEFQGTDITGTNSESTLINNISGFLKTSNLARIPNLVMANKVLTAQVYGYERLLDLSKSKVNKDIFTDVMYNYNNNLPGINADNNKIYTIPYSLIGDDSLAFNLDAMAHIFREIKKNGAQIDENSNIYKAVKAENANLLLAADPSDFKAEPDETGKEVYSWGASNNQAIFTGDDAIINDDTFASFEKITKFALLVSKSLEPESGKKLPWIGMLAYNWILFSKTLLSLYPDSTDSNFLWELKTDGSVNYKFLGDNAEAKKHQENLKTAFNLIISEHSYAQATNKERPFEIGRSGETSNPNYAAPWQLRRNLAAFTYGPNVEYIHSVDSKKSRDDFKPTAAQLATWLKKDEVLWKEQMFKIKAADTVGGFIPDGSALVGIKWDGDKVDKATVAFLEWLFTGTLKKDHGIFKANTKVVDVISQTSGYLIGTKSSVTNETEKEFTSSKDNNENFGNDTDKETNFYSVSSALLTLKDLQNNLNNPNNKLITLDNNAKIQQVINAIETSLNNAQNNKITAEQFLENIINVANSNK